LQFETRPFHLGQVLLDAKRLFSANAQEKGLTLAVDTPLGVPMQLLGDPLRLSQVINNLVGNALKFTEAGEIRIGVNPVDQATAGGRVSLRFSVRDTGIGIDAAQRDSLFEAFTQGDATITRRFGGTGLGLAICHRLVGMMNGRIGVNSASGQGSEFWFTASFEPDLSGAGLAPDPTEGTQPLGHAPAIAAATGLRVLLAEDNELNQIVGRAVLEQMGFEVQVAEDGAEALALVGQNPQGHFNAVLMDLHMPTMGGLEATRRLRALPQGAELPVIALTAAAFSEDRDNCLAAGMDGHISKPLEPEDLRAALQNAQSRRVHPSNRNRGELAQPLPDLPGFDLRPLFERLQGDDKMVWTVLKGFADRERETAHELNELLAQQRLPQARLRVHALMGSAATIGATLVARAGASLEAALEAGVQSAAMAQSVGDALDSSIRVLDQACADRAA
jgi:CheY-like chemotaxis protein/HPt (histidine-containing phosphotransfer) domain-containing protein